MAASTTEKDFITDFKAKLEEIRDKLSNRPSDLDGLPDAKKSFDDCNKRCDTLMATLKSDSNPTFKNQQRYLQEFIPIILDLTFIDENKLLSEDFTTPITTNIIQYILSELDGLLLLGQQLAPHLKLGEVIGDELVECIYWRKGALLYMYCKTIESHEDRIQQDLQQYKQYLVRGVQNLKLMLETRHPLEPGEEIQSNDENSLNLLKSGLYTETHVLALVYTGEMCYWLDKCDKQDYFKVPELDYKRIGQDCLSLYLEVVRGPLKNLGWSCEHADSMLQSLKS